jgi:sugar lactone lactonase YvrE
MNTSHRALAVVMVSLGLGALHGCAGTGSAADAVDAVGDGAADADVPPEADTDPAPVFLDEYPLQAAFPEGGTYDSVDHAFYVGSLADGSIHRVDAATGEERVLFTPTEAGTWWTLGMTVDATRRLLWVCAMDDQRGATTDVPPYDGYVWVLDLATGERTATYNLGDTFATATCTDVALTADGTAYVSDREHPNVYKIDPAGAVTIFATDPALKGGLAGQNAAVVLPDETALMIVVYLDPALVRVDLGDGSVSKVALTGGFSDDDAALAGADGMTWADGALVVAFSSKIYRVTPTDATWSGASTTLAEVPEGMTDVVATPNGVYLLNGQAVRFALGTETDPFRLTRLSGEFK